MPFTLPSLPWKWIGVGFAALAVVAAVGFSINAYGNARYDAGVDDERVIWEKLVAEQQAVLDDLQRKADAALAAQAANDRAAIEQSRKELEDAVAEIPDQQTSDRQRTRACIELLRTGQASPACDTDPAP